MSNLAYPIKTSRRLFRIWGWLNVGWSGWVRGMSLSIWRIMASHYFSSLFLYSLPRRCSPTMLIHLSIQKHLGTHLQPSSGEVELVQSNLDLIYRSGLFVWILRWFSILLGRPGWARSEYLRLRRTYGFCIFLDLFLSENLLFISFSECSSSLGC